jgi:hypothetical protein
MAYQQPLDIYNRALRNLGLPVAGSVNDFSPVQEIIAIYDKVRRAELRRNLWIFATRTVALRAIDTQSQVVTFGAWSASTTYGAGYVVRYNNTLWVSQINANVGNTPGTPATFGQLPWDLYFGPLVINAWNDSTQNTSTTNNISYHIGELVYMLANGAVYASLVEGNQNSPIVVDTWSASTMYSTGAVVSFTPTGGSLTNYQSRVNLNFNYEPDTSPTQWTTTVTNPTVSGSWVSIPDATLTAFPMIFPIQAGPSDDTTTLNAYRLPNGWLREAPLQPKAGANAWLGAHVGRAYDDMTEQGIFLVGPSNFSETLRRFVADIQDVSLMDDMFCEGLAARIAMEAAPELAPERMKMVSTLYDMKMSEARIVDAIEEGPVEQDEDEYITVRL